MGRKRNNVYRIPGKQIKKMRNQINKNFKKWIVIFFICVAADPLP